MSRISSPLLLLCLLAVSFLPSPTLSLRQHGHVQSYSTFHYLTKFVYVSSGGNFTAQTVSTLPPHSPSEQRVLLYPDTLWHDVLASTNCSEQVALGRGAAVGTALDMEVIGHRPHWWYVALVDCQYGNVTGMAMEYTFHFTNGGGTWDNEVSYNEQHIAEISIAYFLFFLLLVPLFVVSALKARSSHAHVPHVLLAIIAASLSLAYLLYAAEFLTLIHTGNQHGLLSSAAYFFQQFAASLLVFCILTTSAGYPLTRPMLAHFPAIFATTFVVFGLYVASFVVQKYTQSAWSSKYVFDNPAGYALAIVYGWLVLVSFALLRSTKRLPNPAASHRTHFYATYFCFLTVYLLSFPFITLGTSLANSWWVAKAELAATGCVLCLAVFGQWVFFQPFTLQTRERRFKTLDEPHASKRVQAADDESEPSVVAVIGDGVYAADSAAAESGDVELSVQHGSGSVVPV